MVGCKIHGCNPLSSPLVTDTQPLETVPDETISPMPALQARKRWGGVVCVLSMDQDRPDLDVMAFTLAKAVAHRQI